MASAQKGSFFPTCSLQMNTYNNAPCRLIFLCARQIVSGRVLIAGNSTKWVQTKCNSIRARECRCVFHFYYLPSAFHLAAPVHLRALANSTRCARLVSPPRPINNRAHVQTCSFALHVHFQYVSTGQLIEFGN